MKITKRKKIHQLLLILVLFLSVTALWLSFKSPIKATVLEKQKPLTNNILPKPDVKLKNSLTKKLDPVENDKGLKATPKIVTIQKDDSFPDPAIPSSIYDLLDELVIPPTSDGVKYKYVDATGKPIKPSSKEIGFQKIYVEITDNESLSSIRVPIPVSIIDENVQTRFNGKIMLRLNKKVAIYPEEVNDKSEAELIEIVKARMGLKVWDVKNGDDLAKDVSVWMDKPSGLGEYKGLVKIIMNGEEEWENLPIVVFGTKFYINMPYWKVNQNEALEADYVAEQFFAHFPVFIGKTKYEWVKNKEGELTTPPNKLDSTQPGYQVNYMKISDESYPDVSTVIRIPMMIIHGENSIIIYGSSIDSKKDTGLTFADDQSAVILENDIKGKSKEEIHNLLWEKLKPRAWELREGKELEIKIKNETIDQFTLGNREIELIIEKENEKLTHEVSVLIVPDAVYEDKRPEAWKNILLNSNEAIINPINGSKLAFPYRGLTDYYRNEEGFIIQDNTGIGYTFNNKRVIDIPGINGKGMGQIINESDKRPWEQDRGIGSPVSSSRFTKKIFLRKGNELKQILLDKEHQLLHVYNMSLNQNLNFKIQLDTYNLASETRSLAMLEAVDIYYYNDYVPIYALGNNSGFYIEPEAGKRFTIKLKDGQGNWLSRFTKYIGGANPIDSSINYFDNDFSGKGTESKNYETGEVIVDGVNSAYQLGAPWKDIPKGKALTTGYEIFAGEEVPYMELKAAPKEFNIYHNDVREFKVNYELSKIPKKDSYGKIEITYPDHSKNQVSYVADAQQKFKGEVTIPRDKLPEKLNETQGTIKKYSTGLLAVEESEGPMKGLPSNEEAIDINVYHFGAKPYPQLIKKGKKFNKSAKDLVVDPVILPGHKASFKYEGDTLEKLDTSTVGTKSVLVRMTDNNDPKQTRLIEVPILVLDKEPPAEGLYLTAENFQSNKETFQGISKDKVNELILEKSKAYAWELGTGSIEGIRLFVESTTLTPNPKKGKYTAVVKAVKGSEILEKNIEINIHDTQKVHVNFLDESGKELHEPIVFEEPVGSSIDLTSKVNIHEAIQSIEAKNYQLTKRPENETAIPVQPEESTVKYQFEGKLFIQSFPTFLNFGRKSLGLPFIKVEKAKYDVPLVIWDNRKNKSTWKLTATLKKPLTSREDPSKILPSAIRYKVDGETTIILSENQVESIAERKHGKEEKYNLSQEWESNKSGMILEVPSGEVLQDGAYRAIILWRVEQTP